MVEHPRRDDRVIAGERARHVLDALARADAELCRLQIDRMRTELGRRHLHRVARPRARLFEIERNALVLKHARRGALRHFQNRAQVLGGEVANGEQVPHQLFSFLIIVPTPWSVRSSISSEWCTRPSMIWAKLTPCSTASSQALSLGFI